MPPIFSQFLNPFYKPSFDYLHEPMFSSQLKTFTEDFISLFFPRTCVHCNKALIFGEVHLCTTCYLDLPKTNYHLQENNPLKQKLIFESKVRSVSSYLFYYKRGVTQSIIYHLKYKNFPEIGRTVGIWYGNDLKDSGISIDLIIPVPLHRSRLRERGYNQSSYFAHGLSQVLRVPVYEDKVIRHVKTDTQTKKRKVNRIGSTTGIYRINGPLFFKNKKVLIVDDVFTTGATVGELASCIAKTEVLEIHVVTMASGL